MLRVGGSGAEGRMDEVLVTPPTGHRLSAYYPAGGDENAARPVEGRRKASTYLAELSRRVSNTSQFLCTFGHPP
ncbi:hypothetical protein [Micromonospora inositola]|uniref:Uncharacterized protein n=1 Tax=Micromonospora inositola TaxID=47865 RepID=A0A1C5HZ67_9ACTN|nr:hypothetical protein [Micromonospora inositola]SCG51252.1 hypothetical protein GA0070613_2020 [Micromonospora inositola]